MEYVIEIIKTRECDEYIDFWEESAEEFSKWPGFVQGQLFSVEQAIRDTHYDLLSLYAFKTRDDAQRFIDDKAAPVPVEPRGVEREVCRLVIELGALTALEGKQRWLVNPFEIGEEEIPGVLDMWDKAKDHMVAKPGFLNARLFRAQGDSFRYGLINIAQWQSAEHFMQALNDKAYDRHRERSENYKLHPSICALVGEVEGSDVYSVAAQ
ncbi:MAG: antibiotic biosynthesis monooxygenase [Methylocystis sp.]|uniref:antibiotic biosynthesis monooxygenase family protein n=1 Tax=Methylocystis sp. TaxID=1911079 RepID=UPI00392A2170